MSRRIKGLTIEINGDTTKLTKALSSVDSALSRTQSNLRDLNKALKLDPSNTALLKDRQQELASAIKNTEEKLKIEKDAYAQLAQADKTPENVERMRQLKEQIDLDTAALKELKTQARDAASVLGSKMQEAGDKISAVGDKIKGVGDKISGFGQQMTAKVTAPIAAAFGGSVKAAVDWESAFTGVMKTVDETSTTTYDDLKAGINDLAKVTAASQNDIAGTMEIAGQLGVSADDILEFTEVMIKLGDTTNLSSEEAASSIAKFANVTNMSLTDVDSLGAAIVDLGNNYATTEADIMNMATRLSGAGSQVGLSQGQILGLATAMSSVGIEAEMGGSAMSKAMVKMQVAVETGFDQVNAVTEKAGMSLRDIELMSTNDTKSFKALAQSLGMTTTELKEVVSNGNNLTNFAEVAGTSTEEFVKLYRDDAPAALQAFINGLGDTDAHGESTIAMLQDMGFTEVRLRDTLTRLANSQGLVTDAMSKGQSAFEDQNALDAEAEKRYATMEAQLQQLKNRFTEVAVSIGEMLMPFVEKLMGFIEGLIEKWNGLDESQRKLILTIAAIAAAIGPILIIVGAVISSIGTIVTAVGTVTSVLGTVMTAVSALSAPILIVIGVIAALVAAFVYFYQTNEEFRNKVKETFQYIMDWISPVIEAVKGFVESCIEFWTTLFSTIKEKVVSEIEENKGFIDGALSFISALIKTKFEIIMTVIKTVLEFIKNLIRAVTSIMKGDWISAVKYLLEAGKSLGDGLKQCFESIKENIVGWFKDIIPKFKEWGKDMIANFVQGIKDKISSVKEAITDIGDAIYERIHFSEPDIGPLSNFSTYAPDMMKLFAQGIKDNAYLIADAMNSSFDLRPYLTNMTSGINKLNATANASMETQMRENIVVQVSLEGDVKRMFNVMSDEAHRVWQTTGQSKLMGY